MKEAVDPVVSFQKLSSMTTLPGAFFALQASVPYSVDNAVAYHGALHAVLDVGHSLQGGGFVLQLGGVHVWDPPEGLAGSRREAHVAGRPVVFDFGPATKVSMPPLGEHGRVVFSTVTPIIIRKKKKPEPSSRDLVFESGVDLAPAMSAKIGQLLGVPKAFEGQDARAVIVQSSMARSDGGWVGSAEVDASPWGVWMLRLSAMTNLGGRSGFGYGQIRLHGAP